MHLGLTSFTARPKFSLTDYQGAVKMLAWSPHEWNVLATGDGTTDGSIKFWNTMTSLLLNSIDTGSQVCSLVWNHSIFIWVCTKSPLSLEVSNSGKS